MLDILKTRIVGAITLPVSQHSNQNLPVVISY